MLTISRDNHNDISLYSLVHDYLISKNTKVFIVHRLDKDTSGIVMFAKSKLIKELLQNNWNNVKREYIAVVNGKVCNEGIIKSYLKETKSLLVYSTNDKGGKLAITEYKSIAYNDKYSLLKINIQTGRKNQIRVHLNDIKHPIVGDKKYGNKKDKEKYLYLHASLLEFYHPITKELISISSDVPKYFNNYFK